MTYDSEIEAIKKVLRYDGASGKLFWIEHPYRRINPGDEAGHLGFHGYINVCVNGNRYLAHRVAFAIKTGKWPTGQIDHINGDKVDNRWVNLRDVSRSENHRNRKIPKHNKSGRIGVRFDKTNNSWVAQIADKEGKKIRKRFSTKEGAVSHRRAMERRFGYHQNHGRPE